MFDTPHGVNVVTLLGYVHTGVQHLSNRCLHDLLSAGTTHDREKLSALQCSVLLNNVLQLSPTCALSDSMSSLTCAANGNVLQSVASSRSSASNQPRCVCCLQPNELLQTQKVYFFWVVREPSALSYFKDTLEVWVVTKPFI